MRRIWSMVVALPLLWSSAIASEPLAPPHGHALFGYVSETSDIIVMERLDKDGKTTEKPGQVMQICGAQRLRPLLGDFVDYAVASALPDGTRTELVDCRDIADSQAHILLIAAHPKALRQAEVDRLVERIQAGQLRKRTLVSNRAYLAASLVRWDGTSSSGKPVQLPGMNVGLYMTAGGGDAICVQPGAQGGLAAAAAVLGPAMAGMRQETLPAGGDAMSRAGQDGRCGVMIGDMASLGKAAADLDRQIPAALREKLLGLMMENPGLASGQMVQAADLIARMLVGQAGHMPSINASLTVALPAGAAAKGKAESGAVPTLNVAPGPIVNIPLEIVILAAAAVVYVGIFYVFGAPSVIATFNGYAAFHGTSPVVSDMLRYFWTATTVITVMASFLCGGIYALSPGDAPNEIATLAGGISYVVAFSSALFAALAERMVVGAIVDFMDRQLVHEMRQRVPPAIKLSTVVGGLAFFSTYLNLVIETRGATLEMVRA